MAVWFIRLGARNQPESRKLYEDFAGNYNLIKIGYGIEHDITSYDTLEKIRKYIASKSKSKRSANIRARLIDQFINGIKKGDTIICPFGNNPIKYRVGKVVSDCDKVESFFEDKEKELQDVIARNEYSDEQGFIHLKPAIEVKWEGDRKDFDKLPVDFQKEFNKPMLATINEFKANSNDDEIDVEETEQKRAYVRKAVLGAGISATILSAILSISFSKLTNIYFPSFDSNALVWWLVSGLAITIAFGVRYLVMVLYKIDQF